MSKPLTADQWTQLLSLLSLDAMEPLLGDMGLPVIDKSWFVSLLRRVIAEARELYANGTGQVPPVPTMLLDRIGTEADKFNHWANGVFLGYHADQPDWSAWDIILSQWAYSRSGDLDFLGEHDREAFLMDYRLKASTDDIREKYGEVLGQPLSDWDVEMFARRGWGIEWEEGPGSIAEAIVRINRLKGVAATLVSRLDESRRTALQLRAQQLIDELHVWMPSPLPSLVSLLAPRC